MFFRTPKIPSRNEKNTLGNKFFPLENVISISDESIDVAIEIKKIT
jgi:hypothetical protein